MSKRWFAFLFACLCGAVVVNLTQPAFAADDSSLQLSRYFSQGSTRQYMIEVSMTSNIGNSTSDPTQMNMKLSMTEKTDSLLTDGSARVNLAFTSLLTDMNGRNLPCRSLPQTSSLVITKQNHINKIDQLNLKGLLPNGTPELGWLGLNYGCLVVFPSNSVKPGSTWESDLTVKGVNTAPVVKHTLVGTEVRQNRKVARILSSFDTSLEKIGFPASDGTVGTVNVNFTSFIDVATGDLVSGEGRSESKLFINPPADRGYATQPLSMTCITTVNIRPLM